MKFISTLFLLCFVGAIQAQVKEVKIPTNLDNITQAYHYNTKQKNFFFLKSYKKLQGVQMSDSLTVKQSLFTLIPDYPNGTIVAFTVAEENKATMYIVTDKNIQSKTFDFEQKTTTTATPFTWDPKEEDSFLHFSHGDKFYALHSRIRNSQIRFLQLDADLKTQKDTMINFTGHNFYLGPHSQVSLNHALQDSVPMTYIEMNQPTDLLKAAAQRKYYIHKDVLYITLDTSNQSTEVLSIDLTTQESTYASYPQPFNKPHLNHPGSNSMLFSNRLVQAYFDKQFITIVLRDQQGEPIKTYQMTKDHADFITGEMVAISNVRGLYKDKYAPIEKRSNFLLRAKNASLYGVIAYPIGDHIVLQFGSGNRTKPFARNFFFDAFINGSRTNMFNPYFKSVVSLASTALDQQLNPDFSFTIPTEDKLRTLRTKRGFRITSNKYKLVLKINDQHYYGKQESRSNTFDLVPF